MTWVKGDKPPQPGRYAVTQDGRSWIAANWTRDGWFDGYRRVLFVKGFCPVPMPVLGREGGQP